jgi:hypothetical protein
MNFRARFCTLAIASALTVCAGAVKAQEVTTYTYDALGRVVGVLRSGGPASGTTTSYTYDPASNRSNVTVTNSPNGAGNGTSGSGATVTSTTKYVIVPLNGYTLIPFQQ